MRIYLAGALFSIAEQNFNQELKNELLKLNSSLDIVLPQDEAKKIIGDPDFENLVFKSCEEEAYSEQIKQEFIPLNNNCIQELIKGESTPFFNNVAKLSGFQLKHFRSMIPDEFLSIWELGLENKMFSLKLCGSGGGGFLLGFTQNYSQTQELLKSKGHKIVTVYQNN